MWLGEGHLGDIDYTIVGCNACSNVYYGINFGGTCRYYTCNANIVENNGYAGICLGFNGVISNNLIRNNGQIGAEPKDQSGIAHGIPAAVTDANNVFGNTIGDSQVGHTQLYGYVEQRAQALATRNRVSDNYFYDITGVYVDATGGSLGNPIVLNNFGYTTESTGTAATITAGNTYVDVIHSLAATPTKVRVTPTTNLGTRSFWVDTKGAATFRININSSDVINHTFDWEAEV